MHLNKGARKKNANIKDILGQFNNSISDPFLSLISNYRAYLYISIFFYLKILEKNVGKKKSIYTYYTIFLKAVYFFFHRDQFIAATNK